MCWIELGWRCGVGLERAGSTNKPADAIPSGNGPSDTNSQPNSSPIWSIARAFRDAASSTACERSTNASRAARRSGIVEDRSRGTAAFYVVTDSTHFRTPRGERSASTFVQAVAGWVHLRAWITAPRLVTVTGVATCWAAAAATSGATNRAIR